MVEAVPGDPVQVGEIIEGRYRIIKPIAQGGMGSVFLAEHWLIKRKVALKILHREYAADADMIRRFMNEALAAGTLGHPNIVESTDMGFTKEDQPYIVFEYVEGRTLADEIDREGSLPVKRAVAIARQIASALGAAHAASIVHRDLKSDNVLVTGGADGTDRVKVLDFGISRFLTARENTQVGAGLVGTPEFMAPEQITTPDTVDKRADIYALGVVLYEMLAGRVPFFIGDGSAPARRRRSLNVEITHALFHRIISEAPPALDRADAPDGLASLVTEKLLAKDPAARCQSMGEVIAALDELANRIQSPRPAALPRRTTEPALASMSDVTLSRHVIDPETVAREVKILGKRWRLEGTNLELELYSRKLTKLAAAAQQLAAVADEMEHYPTVEIEVPKLIATIRPYDDAEAITVMDLVFAARVEQWLRDNWQPD